MFKNASHTPSVIVIVSCYKPSSSFKKKKKTFSSSSWRPTPERSQTEPLYTRTGSTSPLYAASFASCGQTYRFRLRKPRVRLALLQIQYCWCVFHCKSFVIVTPKILDVFDIFEDRSLQSIWSMALFDSFPCYLHHIAFGRLKSHTPFSCSASQLIYIFPRIIYYNVWSLIFLKFQCVLCILNFSVTNTVIRKQSYFRINVCWDIILSFSWYCTHEPREITIKTCKILNRLTNYPSLKLFHAEVNMNNHEYSCIWNNT